MTSILGSEWNLSSDGYNLITENGTIKDYKKVLTAALNTDLKEIGSPVLVKELTKPQTSKIVLQIQKIRNISAPKANEDSQAAPRMLKLILTDGDSHVQAIEVSTINSISRNHTPPGTKILINNAKITSGYILLNSNNCTVLGGKVPHLIEKWEIAKSIQHNKRGNSHNDDGPPPWVNFGAKIQGGDRDQDFKSLSVKSKETVKENTEFELQRQGAIAEANAGAIKKVFGGRVKQNVQPITNQNRPNRERQEKGRVKGRTLIKDRDIEEKPVRPSEKVSLFAFLEDKLPLSEPSQTTAKYASSTENQNYSKHSLNFNKSYDSPSPYKPYSNQQNYNNRNPPIQNRYEKNAPQNFYQNNSSNHFDKPQSSNYPRYPHNDRQDNTNNNAKQYEKPKYQKRNEGASNSKISQGSYNPQKDEVNDLSNNMSKISLNSQFASRSLRQHLNLGQTKKSEEFPIKKSEEFPTKKSEEFPTKKSEEFPKRNENLPGNNFNIGDECMARYWEDGKFYNAIITAITDKTYAVRFKGYGNIEEILKADCSPVTNSNSKQNYGQNQQNRRYDQNSRPYSGSVEFRRSNRNYK